MIGIVVMAALAAFFTWSSYRGWRTGVISKKGGGKARRDDDEWEFNFWLRFSCAVSVFFWIVAATMIFQATNSN